MMSSFFSLSSRCCLLLVLLLGACAVPGAGPRSLPQLMVQRLGWMDEVAQVKQARSLPVTDAKREAELLDAMERAGAEKGLPAEVVRAFFSGQIEAAKVVQREWLARHAGRPVTATDKLPDLATTVRPALDGLGKEMLAALVKARGEKAAGGMIVNGAREEMAREGYSEAVMRPALEGLRKAL